MVREPVHPAPEGVAAKPPQHWPAEDRQTFAKLPPEGQEFLLRRHSEMEGDYQRQGAGHRDSSAVHQRARPVFQDPVIAGSLQQQGLSPYDAIIQWAGSSGGR